MPLNSAFTEPRFLICLVPLQPLDEIESVNSAIYSGDDFDNFDEREESRKCSLRPFFLCLQLGRKLK